MGLFNRFFGSDDRPQTDNGWEGYSVNYADALPDSGVYLDPDAKVMTVAIEMHGATERKARNFLDHLEGVDITTITIRGVDDSGDSIEYTIESGTERFHDGEPAGDD